MSGSTVQSSPHRVPAYLEWVVAGCITIGGIVLASVGSALFGFADRELLAEGIESGQITVGLVDRTLSEAEMLTFVTEVVNWTAIGLVVTGAGLLVFGLGFGVARRRARRRAESTAPTTTSRTYAVFGAVATWVLSFLPFSPLLGGGVAAYLAGHTPERPATVGALSGLVAMLPAFVISGFVTIGIASGLSRLPDGGIEPVTVAVLALGLVFVAGSSVALGALGGFFGDRFVERD